MCPKRPKSGEDSEQGQQRQEHSQRFHGQDASIQGQLVPARGNLEKEEAGLCVGAELDLLALTVGEPPVLVVDLLQRSVNRFAKT